MNEKRWNAGLAEQYVPPFAQKWGQVGPKHPLWHERVKLEIMNLSRYVNFLKSELPRPWFLLKPDPSPRYNFCVWRGYIQIPSQLEIKFEMVILLNSEYPKVIPRCLIDEELIKYAHKIYIKNTWTDPDTKKTYAMICHDHMAELNRAWEPNLGIVHFFIREVWFWFASMQNTIIDNWNKLH